VASHMIREGMVTEGIVMIRAIHDRYDAAKRNPFNEVECGDHYARALASWGALISLSGYEHHGPKHHIAFAPALPGREFRSAFTAAEGWGTFSESTADGEAQVERIEVRWGRLRLKTLAFRAPSGGGAPAVTVRAWGRTLPATHAMEGGRILVTLSEDIVIESGASIEVRIG
jgi:non-lysosomal glucosylceramidase